MKKAVVTFVTNEKEFLYPPVFDFAEVDFLCYTDLRNIKSQFWKICPLDGLSIEDIKLMPEKYLSQYEQVLFVETEAVITKNENGDIKVVDRPDISGCFDEEYFREVSSVVKDSELSENVSETNFKLCMDEEHPIKLTIGMLVGRNSPYFDECFASILRIMRAIPKSELIIVDTGNEDGSVDKVRKAMNEGWRITVVPFKWIYNFAAARNEAVKRAKGSWYMTLDDDEWFEDISAIVEFFESDKELYKKYDYAMYTVRNYKDAKGDSYRDASITRLARNRSDLCYVGRIHENFNFSEKDRKTYIIDSYVHHYSYINDVELRKLKSQRNMALLAVDNEKNPMDNHTIVQIIQEMMFAGRLELAYAYLMRGLSVQRVKTDSNIGVYISVLGAVLNVVNKDELWNYEAKYIRKIGLNYIQMAAVVYHCALAAWRTVLGLCGREDNCLKTEVSKYLGKTIDYSVCFEKTYNDYNNASLETRYIISGSICENYCVDEKALTDMLVIRALAYDRQKEKKETVAMLNRIKAVNVNLCAMEYYRLIIEYNIANVEFYNKNKNVSGIWMLFIQALLIKATLCAELIKTVDTSVLDKIIEEAKSHIKQVEMEEYAKAFEELMVLRLACEYMQVGEYKIALNAIKIAVQGSEQTRAVAIILFEDLKGIMN